MSAAAEAVSNNAPQIAVEVDHVTKIYPGGVEALNDMTIQFPRGELTSLLGPSGCGKTTTAMVGTDFIGDDLAQLLGAGLVGAL